MGLTGHWYNYRDEVYKQTAKKICEREDLIY